MRRAQSVRQAGQWDNAAAIDRVVLDASERHRRRLVLTAERGTTLLLDLPHATTLKDGDGLVLDDGAVVGVIGKPEPLHEIAATNPVELARLAWHLGNRHADVQVVGECASELVHVGQMALIAGFDGDVFIEATFNFPTLAEGYRVAALDVVRKRPA